MGVLTVPIKDLKYVVTRIDLHEKNKTFHHSKERHYQKKNQQNMCMMVEYYACTTQRKRL